MPKPDIAKLTLAANTLRCLAADGVQAAKSGHPGLPLGMADVAATLWLLHHKHSPQNPDWPDRDRFVLSGGHGSMLLYALLHLSGYALPLDELKRFRQLDSLTPGHPEFPHTPGVETTTGPLGQGLANAVGMALAERMMAARFNPKDTPGAFKPVDHYTYAFCGDGDLMEGVSHEAISLAGHLRLNKLIVFFDSNAITIEGDTSLAVSDNPAMRFKACGWNVLTCDGHNFMQIDKAVRKAKKSAEKPVLVICKTTIGKGAPTKAGSAEVHGAPLGDAEIAAMKKALGFPPDKTFHIPDEVRALFIKRAKKLTARNVRWNRNLKKWKRANENLSKEWNNAEHLATPRELEKLLPAFDKPVATRSASGIVLNALAPHIPMLVGGSADLAPSTMTWLNGFNAVTPADFSGRNLHFGIREFGMAAIMNGIARHGGFRVFGATFFVFSDYARPAVRLAALMGLPVVYVFTHDSFYVGEDGPTHQPVEHLAALRAIPGLTVIRPADATETAAAWQVALENKTGPTALCLTRQNITPLDRAFFPPANLLAKGAYTLWQAERSLPPDAILVATGSEVELALEAAKRSTANLRVVSMPSWELFEKQPLLYKDQILPPSCTRRLSIEAGSSFGWQRYAAQHVSLDTYGASAPFKDLCQRFGFTVEKILERVNKLPV